jgi:hypothetical protein
MEKKPNYYELNIYSAGAATEWGSRIAMVFAGATYDEIVAKAKEHNVDMTDLEKWETAVYYRVPVTFEIVASCTLHADENGCLYWSYVSDKIAYDGKDPIPKFYKERKK